jgi:6-phosphofructokinase 1
MSKNVIIAQSGGPSPVINNSLRGIIDTCKRFPGSFKNIYAGWHGIEGVLKEELLDL